MTETQRERRQDDHQVIIMNHKTNHINSLMHAHKGPQNGIKACLFKSDKKNNMYYPGQLAFLPIHECLNTTTIKPIIRLSHLFQMNQYFLLLHDYGFGMSFKNQVKNKTGRK